MRSVRVRGGVRRRKRRGSEGEERWRGERRTIGVGEEGERGKKVCGRTEEWEYDNGGREGS